MRSVEAGVDLDRGEARRVALQVRPGGGEQLRLLLPNDPSRDADVHYADYVFVFFSNKLGWVGSIVVSIIGTALLLLLMRSCA